MAKSKRPITVPAQGEVVWEDWYVEEVVIRRAPERTGLRARMKLSRPTTVRRKVLVDGPGGPVEEERDVASVELATPNLGRFAEKEFHVRDAAEVSGVEDLLNQLFDLLATYGADQPEM